MQWEFQGPGVYHLKLHYMSMYLYFLFSNKDGQFLIFDLEFKHCLYKGYP